MTGGLAGAPTQPVIVPPSFVQRAQPPVPESDEVMAVGGIDLENLSGDMPGRLQSSYDVANNAWVTLTTQMPDFVHHHGCVALEGRIFVIGQFYTSVVNSALHPSGGAESSASFNWLGYQG